VDFVLDMFMREEKKEGKGLFFGRKRIKKRQLKETLKYIF